MIKQGTEALGTADTNIVLTASLTSAATSTAKTRILVIAPNWIGDAIMAQPLLALLRQQYPDQPIDVLAPSWVAPVLRAMPEVDTVLENTFARGRLQLRERWRYACLLRQRGYGAAYILPNTLKFALLPWLAGIKTRIGYKGESRYGLINVMHYDNARAPRPMVALYAALAGAPSTQTPQKLPLPSLHLERKLVLNVLTALGLVDTAPIVVFAPGAEFGNAKRWPASHFAQLARTILSSKPDAQVVLLGSPKDQTVCDEIKTLCPAVHHLAGKTTLAQATAVIAGATAVVSNDSGLLHIASALNRPVIALYGPTSPDHAPPFSDIAYSLSLRMACAPCKQRECPLGHQDCLQKIQSQDAWIPLQNILRRADKLTSELVEVLADELLP
ncbi:lipopolysaccharide heptosyltransferase II [soil metagenome]